MYLRRTATKISNFEKNIATVRRTATLKLILKIAATLETSENIKTHQHCSSLTGLLLRCPHQTHTLTLNIVRVP